MKISLLILSTLLMTACANSSNFFKEHEKADKSSASSATSPAALNDEQVRAVRAQSFGDVYLHLAQEVSNNSFTVDGLTFHSLKSHVADLQAAFDALQDKYANLGEYLDAKGAGASIEFDASTFHATLAKAHDFFENNSGSETGAAFQGSGSLGLLDDNACYSLIDAANARNAGYCIGSAPAGEDPQTVRSSCDATTAFTAASDSVSASCKASAPGAPLCIVNVNGVDHFGNTQAECDTLNEYSGQILAAKNQKK